MQGDSTDVVRNEALTEAARKRRRFRQGETLDGAALYFSILRTMNPSPRLLAAIERAEREHQGSC